jgi:hypothetical protein
MRSVVAPNHEPGKDQEVSSGLRVTVIGDKLQRVAMECPSLLFDKHATVMMRAQMNWTAKRRA